MVFNQGEFDVNSVILRALTDGNHTGNTYWVLGVPVTNWIWSFPPPTWHKLNVNGSMSQPLNRAACRGLCSGLFSIMRWQNELFA